MAFFDLEWDTHEIDNFVGNLENVAIFEQHMTVLAEDISRFLLHIMRTNTPVGKTYKLQSSWMADEEIQVTREKNGYSVTLINRCEYAKYVNEGHYSYNQFNKGGEPYIVKNRTVPFDPNFGSDYPNDIHYVFGRFFVENTILQVASSTKLTELIYSALQRWWKSC